MKYLISSFLLLISFIESIGQDTTFVLSTEMYNDRGMLSLPTMDNWFYQNGNNPEWANPDFDISNWQSLDSTQLTELKVDDNGRFEAWFRVKLKLDTNFFEQAIYIYQSNKAASDIYVNGELLYSFGQTGANGEAFKNNVLVDQLPSPISLDKNKELIVAIHIVDEPNFLRRVSSYSSIGRRSMLYFAKYEQVLMLSQRINSDKIILVAIMSLTGLIVFLSWLMAFVIQGQRHIINIAMLTTGIFLLAFSNFIIPRISSSSVLSLFAVFLMYISLYTIFVSLPILIFRILKKRITLWLKYYAILSISFIPLTYYFKFPFAPIVGVISFLICISIIVSEWKKIYGSQWAIVVGLILMFIAILTYGFFIIFRFSPILDNYSQVILSSIYINFPVCLLIYIVLWLKETIRDERINAQKVVQVTEEKRDMLANQNKILEQKVEERTADLKASQKQLIQSEKMASLGELTAGIAHEIQNPLNFVNNFSEVSEEMLEEMDEELDKGEIKEAKEISADLKQNLQKINHHGNRASSIVKGMLEHSQTSTGEKVLTDINALADEYLRLAYHGLRAKDKDFQSDFKTDFDENLPKVNWVSQDIGRVILNLINNSFQVVTERSRSATKMDNFKPLVTISTKLTANSQVLIAIKDNGPGIPDSIKDKIFQPFFTTKPTGKGTGLGLSLAYDIVKAHGGELTLKTGNDVGAEFMIHLPIK